jgi:DNA-binding MarR family transcriptional regulator
VDGANVKQTYLDSISLIERLHRQFLEVVKTELDRHGIEDVNNVQALILYNVADESVTVGELTNRGYYLGSNVSYNLKKMVENGYLVQERSNHDRRSVRVRLTAKGSELRRRIDTMFGRHVERLERDLPRWGNLAQANDTLESLERFWNEVLEYNLRAPRETESASV